MELDLLKDKYLGIPEGSLMQAAVLRDFVEEKVWPERLNLEGGFHRDAALGRKTKDALHQELVDLSQVRGLFPPEIDGVGMPWMMEFLYPSIEELSRGDCGLFMDVLVPGWSFLAATKAPNMDILKDYGSIFTGPDMHHACLAMTEPHGGCNILDESMQGKTLRTTAVLDGDDYVINGLKLWPSGSGEAEYFMTVCTTDPSLGDEGICLLYHPRDVEGLSTGPNIHKMGMIYTDFNGWIKYENVRVPKKYRAAGPGKDAKLWRDALAVARFLSAPMSLGAAQAGFEIALEYTRTRIAGNKPVREHSMHAAMLADMAISIEAARAYNIQVARMFDKPEQFGPWHEPYLSGKASGAKVMSTETAINVLNKAMELCGATAFTQQMPIEKYLRDVKIIQLWEGGSQLARMDMARSFYPVQT